MENVIVEEYGKDVKVKWRSRWDTQANRWAIVDRQSAPSYWRFLSLAFWRSMLIDVFLPQGYPYSVADDYARYQLWDTVQAFASSINAALATEAVLKGAGVGDKSATALAATLTWLMRDGVGMVGRIVFAWARGSRLDCDCKKWRLMADLLNDIAFAVDLLAGNVISELFTPLVCISSLLRAVVGVAGAATRTAVVQHQALRNNLADVSAKDGSQETLVNVSALLVSLVLLPAVSGKPLVVAGLCCLFTAIHLFANYRAVRSLHLNTLNCRTLRIAVEDFCKTGHVPSVRIANDREPLFASLTGRRHFGCSIRELLQNDGDCVCTEQCTIQLGRDDTGWIAMAARGGNARDQLMAAFRLEYRSFTHKWPLDDELKSFESELLATGWRVDIHQLGFDDWSYRLQD